MEDDDLFNTSTEDLIARVITEADRAAQDIQTQIEQEDREQSQLAKELRAATANDEAFARAQQEVADAELARELEAQDRDEHRSDTTEVEREQTKQQEREELAKERHEGRVREVHEQREGRKARSHNYQRRGHRNPAGPMYEEHHRRLEEDAAAQSDIQVPQRNPSRARTDSAVDIFAKQAPVHEGVDLEEGEMIQDDNDVNQWISTPRAPLYDHAADQVIEETHEENDPISQRIDRRYLRPVSVKRRDILDTASINPNPEQPSPAPTRTMPGIKVLSPSPPPETHWRSLKREGRPKHSLERIDTDYLLSATTIDDINNMLDGIYGMQRDQAAAVMESFTKDPENTRPGREVEFIESGFRSWSIRLRNPNPNQRLRYADYGEDREAYNNLPDDCNVNGCDNRCPAPRTKDDDCWSIRRGRMLQRREQRLGASGSGASSSIGVLPESLGKAKDRSDMPPPLPLRRRPPMRLSDLTSQARALTPTGSSQPTVGTQNSPSSSPQVQLHPNPRPVKLTLKLDNAQRKAMEAVRPHPTVQSRSTPSEEQLHFAVQNAVRRLHQLHKLQEKEQKISMKKYRVHEGEVQDATETMTHFRNRVSDGLKRFPWASHSPMRPPDRRWAVKPGVTKSTRSGYRKFAGIVKPTQAFYSRRASSSQARSSSPTQKMPKRSKQPKEAAKRSIPRAEAGNPPPRPWSPDYLEPEEISSLDRRRKELLLLANQERREELRTRSVAVDVQSISQSNSAPQKRLESSKTILDSIPSPPKQRSTDPSTPESPHTTPETLPPATKTSSPRHSLSPPPPADHKQANDLTRQLLEPHPLNPDTVGLPNQEAKLTKHTKPEKHPTQAKQTRPTAASPSPPPAQRTLRRSKRIASMNKSPFPPIERITTSTTTTSTPSRVDAVQQSDAAPSHAEHNNSTMQTPLDVVGVAVVPSIPCRRQMEVSVAVDEVTTDSDVSERGVGVDVDIDVEPVF
ncbi:Nn.00g077490.m01.CDS01 [Neocucurbitaria sp. VM-36]